MKVDRNVILLGIASFINDISSELISAVLPLFIIQLGGGGIALGTVSGLRELLSNVLKPVSGYLSDRFSRKKPLILSGYFLSALFKLLIGLSKDVGHVVLSSTLERIGKGLRTAPRDAVISLSRGKSGRKFGIHRSMDTAGALLGVLLATFLTYMNFSIKTVILIGGIIAFFSLVPLIPIKEPKVKEQKLFHRKDEKFLSGEFLKVLVIITTYSAGTLSAMFLIFVAGRETSERTALTLYCILNFAYLLTAIPAGNLSDKLGKGRILATGYLITAFSLLLLSAHHGLTFLTLSFILYGISLGISDTVQRAFVEEISGKAKRGTAYGLLHGLTGLGLLTGNVSAGYLWNAYGNLSFIPFSFLCFISSIVLFRKS